VSIRVCSHVAVACDGVPRFTAVVNIDGKQVKVPALVYGVVKKGDKVFGSCTVVSCYPNPCLYVATITRLMLLDEYKRVEHEVRGNIAVIRIGKKVYVYPAKVWQETLDVVSDFESGKKLKKQGIAYIGPPGTGKSSIAYIVSEMLKVPVFEVAAHRILVKWLGESEKTMAELLTNVEMSAPSVMLADEADWLFASRFTASEEEVGRVYLNLMSQVLSTLQRWNNQSIPVLVLATTNAPLERLDKALFRAGRLGDPVFVPLPDINIVKTYIEEQLDTWGVKRGEQEIAEASTKALALGLSMADIASAVESAVEKNRSLVEEISRHRPKETPYYRRGFAEPRTIYGRELLNNVKNRWGFLSKLERSQLHISMDEPVAIALATAVAIHVIGSQVVIAVDYNYLDSTIETAEQLEAVLVVPTESMPREVLSKVVMKAKKTIFAGNVKPAPWVMEMHIPAEGRNLYGLLDIALSFYGASYAERDIDKLRTATTTLRDVLKYIASVPSIEVLKIV
jgi:SpoVK/Ycf46/Vps4 family AAA+-type ATPase